MHCGTLITSVSRLGGGLYALVRGLGLGLVRHGVRVTVLGVEDAHTAADLGAWEGLDVRVLSRRGPPSFAFAPRLRFALEEADPDLTHCHGLWQYPSLAELRWARRRNRPCVISPQGMLDPWALRHSGWKKVLAGRLFENEHLRRAACLHAVAQSELDAIRAYGLRNPIGLVPNGIDFPPARTDTPPPWAAEIDAGRPVVLFLGRLHPKKGLPALLAAWARVTADGPDSRGHSWALVIAGWDQLGHEDELKRRAAGLGLGERVRFIGPLFGERKAAALQGASAFVLPSLSEGMPAAVLEAWSYGLPVLMTPQCNIPEGFEADAALRIEPEADSVRQGLETLFEMSDGQRGDMGARGRQLVETRFNWDRIAARMHGIYAWALGGGTPPDDVVMD